MHHMRFIPPFSFLVSLYPVSSSETDSTSSSSPRARRSKLVLKPLLSPPIPALLQIPRLALLLVFASMPLTLIFWDPAFCRCLVDMAVNIFSGAFRTARLFLPSWSGPCPCQRRDDVPVCGKS